MRRASASCSPAAAGVIYVPFDEDSYGYVTLEAFHSAQAGDHVHGLGGHP